MARKPRLTYVEYYLTKSIPEPFEALSNSNIIMYTPVPPKLPGKAFLHYSQESNLYILNDSEILARLQGYPEIRTLGQNMHTVWHLNGITPILQKGPQCGLVALAMAANLLNKNVKVEEMFEYAKCLKISKCGEIFDINHMALLGSRFLETSFIILSNNKNIKYEICNLILKKSPLLIPYDDLGNQPSNKKGHKAHWALLTGFAIVIPFKNENCPKITNLSANQILTTEMENIINSGNHFFVIAMQGKSSRPGVWRLEDLLQSNANLETVNPKMIKTNNFIIPKDGNLKELKMKIIAFTNT